ncbi:MAG: AAA family ATPase, partial [Candidatus Uhrbacteria bacterium]
MKTSSEGGSMYQKLRGLERHRDALTRSEKMLSSLSNKQGETFLSDIEDILKDIDIIVGTEEVVEGIDDEKNEIKEIEEQIATINEQVEPKLIKSEKQKAFKQLSLFMRQRKGLLENKTKLSKKVKELIRAVHADSKLREQSMAWQKVSEFENAVSGIENKIFELAKENPVAFQAYWLLKLRDWKKSYEQFGIIETESMEEQTKQIMDDARRKLEGTNGVITLLGPTGSGKTVLAKKVAEQFSTDGNFEFVSAHPKMTAFDLIQRMGIVVEELVPEQVPQKIKEAQQKYKLENPDLSEKELTTELKTIKAVIEGRAKEKTFETKPILEAVGRAKKEGHIVVIDEFNYLPPDTLAALNDILSSKDNPPGFGVVFTGNIGKEYLKRQGLDPAFVNRVLSGTVHYELPPQEIDQALDDSILTNEQLRLADVTPERNLY